jgi:hypothetical protein
LESSRCVDRSYVELCRSYSRGRRSRDGRGLSWSHRVVDRTTRAELQASLSRPRWMESSVPRPVHSRVQYAPRPRPLTRPSPRFSVLALRLTVRLGSQMPNSSSLGRGGAVAKRTTKNRQRIRPRKAAKPEALRIEEEGTPEERASMQCASSCTSSLRRWLLRPKRYQHHDVCARRWRNSAVFVGRMWRCSHRD